MTDQEKIELLRNALGGLASAYKAYEQGEFPPHLMSHQLWWADYALEQTHALAEFNVPVPVVEYRRTYPDPTDTNPHHPGWKLPEEYQWSRSGDFSWNIEQAPGRTGDCVAVYPVGHHRHPEGHVLPSTGIPWEVERLAYLRNGIKMPEGRK